MALSDIGIDLGTSSVLIYNPENGIILHEPSVVAVNADTGTVLAVGDDAYKMVGKTPGKIKAVYPLTTGIISDFYLAEEMVKYFIKKSCATGMVKPRVAICVPSGITDVESRAVINVAVKSGARKVFLIEEPVAAAIGAGIDITRPNGHIILDIGGGTTDIAILSLNGIVNKTSVKVAGRNFNEAIIKYMRNTHNILIGEKMADTLKCEIASVFFRDDEDISYTVKGRNLVSGLPQKVDIKRSEICPIMLEMCDQIVGALQSVLEVAPPELSADILNNGLTMTGGGSLLHGLDRYIKYRLKINAYVAENPIECVAIGTGKSFLYLDKLFDGFIESKVHQY